MEGGDEERIPGRVKCEGRFKKKRGGKRKEGNSGERMRSTK